MGFLYLLGVDSIQIQVRVDIIGHFDPTIFSPFHIIFLESMFNLILLEIRQPFHMFGHDPIIELISFLFNPLVVLSIVFHSELIQGYLHVVLLIDLVLDFFHSAVLFQFFFDELSDIFLMGFRVFVAGSLPCVYFGNSFEDFIIGLLSQCSIFHLSVVFQSFDFLIYRLIGDLVVDLFQDLKIVDCFIEPFSLILDFVFKSVPVDLLEVHALLKP